jgi:hypothetical protein
MKNPLLAITFIAFPLSAKTTRLRNYGCIAIVLLAGCTAAQVRWDATRMRKDVMVYYNDQIMDNLIRAKNHLPFVHVDINLLTSTGGSQISGSIGYGETTTNTGTQALTTQTTTTNVTGVSHQVARVVGGLVATASHIAMRPFAYSVTPQQTETLTISTVPALGSQALTSPPPTELGTPTPAPTPEVTKTTITYGPDGNETTCVEELALKPRPTPMPGTIYQLYEKFACCYVKERSKHPNKDDVLPGTVIKWWDTTRKYYYIDKNATCANRKNAKDAYYDFCKALFTKGQSPTGTLEKALQLNQAQSAAGFR